MSPFKLTRSTTMVLLSLVGAEDHMSYARRIANETGLTAATTAVIMQKLVDGGFADRLPDQASTHGTPRRPIRLTAAGAGLARACDMKRRPQAARRLRGIAAALDLPAGNPLAQAADRLDRGRDDQLSTLTQAVLGPTPPSSMCPVCAALAQ